MYALAVFYYYVVCIANRGRRQLLLAVRVRVVFNLNFLQLLIFYIYRKQTSKSGIVYPGKSSKLYRERQPLMQT
jgi:hypothetical protein